MAADLRLGSARSRVVLDIDGTLARRNKTPRGSLSRRGRRKGRSGAPLELDADEARAEDMAALQGRVAGAAALWLSKERAAAEAAAGRNSGAGLAGKLCGMEAEEARSTAGALTAAWLALDDARRAFVVEQLLAQLEESAERAEQALLALYMLAKGGSPLPASNAASEQALLATAHALWQADALQQVWATRQRASSGEEGEETFQAHAVCATGILYFMCVAVGGFAASDDEAVARSAAVAASDREDALQQLEDAHVFRQLWDSLVALHSNARYALQHELLLLWAVQRAVCGSLASLPRVEQLPLAVADLVGSDGAALPAVTPFHRQLSSLPRLQAVVNVLLRLLSITATRRRDSLGIADRDPVAGRQCFPIVSFLVVRLLLHLLWRAAADGTAFPALRAIFNDLKAVLLSLGYLFSNETARTIDRKHDVGEDVAWLYWDVLVDQQRFLLLLCKDEPSIQSQSMFGSRFINAITKLLRRGDSRLRLAALAVLHAMLPYLPRKWKKDQMGIVTAAVKHIGPVHSGWYSDGKPAGVDSSCLQTSLPAVQQQATAFARRLIDLAAAGRRHDDVWAEEEEEDGTDGKREEAEDVEDEETKRKRLLFEQELMLERLLLAERARTTALPPDFHRDWPLWLQQQGL